MDVIPFHRPSIDQEEIDEVISTLRSGWLTTGPRTKQFEREFANFVHCREAVAVNSCTAALHLALEAIGLQPGDGVLVPTMTFAATAEVVRYFGATPVLADCREADFNLDPADADRRVRDALERGIKMKAIIPVHFGGQIGDVVGFRGLAERYKMVIVEDAAHCCPGYYRMAKEDPWESAGRIGTVGCYSFYANKTITTGEGGMACTDDAEIADRMRIMSLHGISRDAWKRFTAGGHWYYEIVAPGYKYNLTDIASALGVVQLRKAPAFRDQRARLAALYAEKLSAVEELRLPQEHADRIHSWHLYVIRLRSEFLPNVRDAFIEELKREGIGSSVHYTPLHMHPYYRETYGYGREDLPCMARVYPEVVSLPIFPGLSEDQVNRICDVVKRLVAKFRCQK